MPKREREPKTNKFKGKEMRGAIFLAFFRARARYERRIKFFLDPRKQICAREFTIQSESRGVGRAKYLRCKKKIRKSEVFQVLLLNKDFIKVLDRHA
jgi:hypothetical protein